MSSKYKTLKTDTMKAKWGGVVPVDNVRRFPKHNKKS